MKKSLLLTFCLVLFVGTLLAGIPFTLRNSSAVSIPLRIPGVMNPNLSPFSNSGVDLAIGQEVYFYHKKKKYVLLVVDESINGQTLIVNELIKKRKKDLGLEE